MSKDFPQFDTELEAVALHTVIFSANGEYLITGGYLAIQVWRVKDAKEMASIKVGEAWSLAVSKDGRWIGARMYLPDKWILWDAQTYEEVFSQEFHECSLRVSAVDFSPDSTRLLMVGPYQNAVTVLDIATREPVFSLLDHQDRVCAAKYSPQGDRIATGTHFNVRIYDGNDGHLLVDVPIKVIPLHNKGIVWANDRLFVVSRNKVQQVESSTGSTISEWPLHFSSSESSIALSKPGKFIVVNWGGFAKCWDLSTHIYLGQMYHRSRVIDSMAISPDEQLIVFCGESAISIQRLSRHNMVPLIYISEIALDFWEQGRLEDTEASLTETITSSTESDHHALANRALVRTHLGHWDVALDDAENSVKIQPSMIGTIARSIALVGAGRKAEGCRMFDFAFRHCDDTYINFLLLIKAIVLFIAGEHEDAVSRVGDLIATVNPDIIYCEVQAYMYFLLGSSQMENRDYEGAVQSFERARTQTRYYSGFPLLSISLISGWKFDNIGITIQQRLCEALYTVGRAKDAGEVVLTMTNTFDEEAHACNPIANWVSEFKLRCYEQLVRLGGESLDARRHDEAIVQYSVAIALNPDTPHGIFIKRGKARLAEGLWEDALADANEAIARDPSSPWGYEVKHAALHGIARYVDAIEAFETMLSKIAQSPDPDIRARHDQYISPSNTRMVVRRIVRQTIHHSPRVLINTFTGRLQDRAEQASAFESHPLFSELVSSMTTRVDRARIKREVKQHFQYVMLSHKWEENEPLFQQVAHMVVYDLDESPTHNKLRTFCTVVRDAGFNWAWSDTCCINKQDHFVFQEALVAMFKWYRGSAMMIVFLRGIRSAVERGDLAKHIWNTRAWTFQEYVAAKVIHFYTEDWTPYLDLGKANHKESPEIIWEMEQATGVSAQQLTALRPGLDSIREKLYLASTRETTLVEDAAYSLLGIFSVTGIPAIYGEGEGALGRLLAHIIAGSGDVTILAWSGQSSSYNSCLPARINAYSRPATSHLPRPLGDSELENIVAALRASSLDVALAQKLYDRLNELSTPWFAGSRMKLPCIAFGLPPLSHCRTTSSRVYHVETPAFGMVEIKTRQDLSRLKSLYLVYPWLDSLLGREAMQSGALAEDDVDIAEPSSPGTDDEDVFDEEIGDESSLLPELGSPLAPVHEETVPIDKETATLQLIARLRQPFGALLFTLASTGRRAVEYKRVAADSIITVQIRENVPLNELLDNVRTLDVL